MAAAMKQVPAQAEGGLPSPRGGTPLLQLAVEAVLPILGGCAGALAGGLVGGAVGAALGQAAEKAINYFGQHIVGRWLGWMQGLPAGTRIAAVEQLAEVLPEVARSQVAALLKERAPQASEADLQLALDYLTAIPSAVRRSLLSTRHKGGKALPPRLALDDAQGLLRLLPTGVPPYPAPCPLPGTDYRLEELVGAGGFGAVYRASVSSEQYLDRAIKFCLDRSLLPALERERANLERLMREGRESWSPRLVRLYGYNLEHQTPFLVYEYVPGGDLARWLAARQARDGAGPGPDEVLGLIVQVAEALAFAHRRGLVHRDLKPANVLMGEGTIKLADFGIGGVMAALPGQASRIGTLPNSRLRPDEQASLFRGAGTPLYMSWEQKQGEPPDPRNDVYSLGVMWYQLLAGDVSREMHPGWAEELADEHAAPAAHVALIKLCVGPFKRRPENAGKLLEALHGLVAPVARLVPVVAHAEAPEAVPVLELELEPERPRPAPRKPRPAPEAREAPPPLPSRGSWSWVKVAAAAVAVLVLCGVPLVWELIKRSAAGPGPSAKRARAVKKEAEEKLWDEPGARPEKLEEGQPPREEAKAPVGLPREVSGHIYALSRAQGRMSLYVGEGIKGLPDTFRLDDRTEYFMASGRFGEEPRRISAFTAEEAVLAAGKSGAPGRATVDDAGGVATKVVLYSGGK